MIPLPQVRWPHTSGGHPGAMALRNARGLAIGQRGSHEPPVPIMTSYSDVIMGLAKG